jgi:nicotinate-nucleotide adenylyltransferase
MERLGIYGGTFDPLHFAHLILAEEAHFHLDLDRVLWVLTPDPPHKKGRITPVKHRLDMLVSEIASNADFELSNVDLERPGPYYAVDTVIMLRRQHPNAHLVYLMGGDSLHDLPGWHRPRDFVTACDAIGVLRRPGDEVDMTDLEGKLPGLSAKVRFVEAPSLDISGTFIRQRIVASQPFRYYVPLSVYQLIQERNLYTWD